MKISRILMMFSRIASVYKKIYILTNNRELHSFIHTDILQFHRQYSYFVFVN